MSNEQDNVILLPGERLTITAPKWSDPNFNLISFHENGQEVATINIVNGQLVVKGNLDEGARIFLENVRRSGQTMLDRIHELEATKH